MKTDMQLKNEIWKAMPRNDVEEMARADRFYDEVLMPLSLRTFVNKEKRNQRKNYDGMVLTLGTSWQPLALSISVLQPKRVLVLGTADTEKYFEKLVDFLGDRKMEWQQVDRVSVQHIYFSCKQWKYSYSDMKTVCVDITGGTKAMVSGLAMYAATEKWDIFYIESKYLPLYRRPEPGNETLVKLRTP